MEDLLFKYVLKNKHTDRIYCKTYSIHQIEESGLASLFDVENYTILKRLRFTGLLDKNGNKIFEGDILSVNEFKNNSFEFPFDEQDEIRDTYTLSELKGLKTASYTSDVKFEDGEYVLCDGSKDGFYNTPLYHFYGEQKNSSTIHESEITGNIHDETT